MVYQVKLNHSHKSTNKWRVRFADLFLHSEVHIVVNVATELHYGTWSNLFLDWKQILDLRTTTLRMLRSYYICWGGGVCVLGLLGVKEIGYFQRPNTHNLGVAKPTNLSTWWLTRNCKLHWKSTNLSTWWLTRNCKNCIELAQSVIKSCR